MAKLPVGIIEIRIIHPWPSQVLAPGIFAHGGEEQPNHEQRKSVDDGGQ
jgi:hypothetical protein